MCAFRRLRTAELFFAAAATEDTVQAVVELLQGRFGLYYFVIKKKSGFCELLQKLGDGEKKD